MGRHSPSVLVVDDDEATRALVAEVLGTDLGATVRHACDGQEAIAAVLAARPDLIVLDLMMPRLDGLAVLERLESSPGTAGVPVLVMTGWATAATLAALARRCDGVIDKPFDLDELVARAGACIGQRGATGRPAAGAN
jgi:CheY-like chemotaxis protein